MPSSGVCFVSRSLIDPHNSPHADFWCLLCYSRSLIDAHNSQHAVLLCPHCYSWSLIDARNSPYAVFLCLLCYSRSLIDPHKDESRYFLSLADSLSNGTIVPNVYILYSLIVNFYSADRIASTHQSLCLRYPLFCYMGSVNHVCEVYAVVIIALCYENHVIMKVLQYYIIFLHDGKT